MEKLLGATRTSAALELLDLADTVIREILYIHDFAKQKIFFRRVRIPPLLHVYWDSLFINHGVRKLMRHFVGTPERSLAGAEAAVKLFPRMIACAREASLPCDDIEHMQDFFQLILLARKYYFLPFDDALAAQIRSANNAYKQRWPKEIRQRYRIRISFDPFPLKRRTLAIAVRLLLRQKRGYRWLDWIVILPLSGLAFRILRPRDPDAMPKYLRKSAMGVETLFK